MKSKISTKKRKIGDLGEEIAHNFLIKHGYNILDRNYLKIVGEIDIIARFKNTLHFIEVKTIQITQKETTWFYETTKLVSRDTYNPLENVTSYKLQRIYRTISEYLKENAISRETRWQVDVISIVLSKEKKTAELQLIENVL